MMSNVEIIRWLESLKSEIGKQNNHYLWNYEEAIDNAIEALYTEPKIGVWVLKQGWDYCCSCCGEESGLDETDVFVYGMKLPNYCPNCGAKMESRKNE